MVSPPSATGKEMFIFGTEPGVVLHQEMGWQCSSQAQNKPFTFSQKTKRNNFPKVLCVLSGDIVLPGDTLAFAHCYQEEAWRCANYLKNAQNRPHPSQRRIIWLKIYTTLRSRNPELEWQGETMAPFLLCPQSHSSGRQGHPS